MTEAIPVGKFRRQGKVAVDISYDPSYGIRIEGAPAPADPEEAGAWCRRAGGWLRLRRGVAKAVPAVAEFVRAWRRA